MSQRRWSATWHAWLTAVLVSFAALETRALLSQGESATLTAHLRRTLGVHPRKRLCWAGRSFIAGVLGWLTIHLCAGILPSDGWMERRKR